MNIFTAMFLETENFINLGFSTLIVLMPKSARFQFHLQILIRDWDINARNFVPGITDLI